MMRFTPSALVAMFMLYAMPALAWAGYPEILYYSFNEGQGTTTENLASPGQGGAQADLIGATWVSPGRFGDAVNTSSGYVDTYWNTEFSSSVTVEFWFRVTTASLHVMASDDATNFLMYLSSGDWLYAGGNGMTYLSSNVPGLSNGQWHHVAFVYDDSVNETYLYSNGNLVATGTGQTANATPSSTTLHIGQYFSTYNFQGDIDEFRVWGQARSQAEIQATMNSELGELRFENLDTGSTHIVSGDTSQIGGFADSTSHTVTYRVSSMMPTANVDITSINATNLVNVSNVNVTPGSVSGITTTNSEDLDVQFTPLNEGTFSFALEFTHNGTVSPSPFILNVEGYSGPRLTVYDGSGVLVEPGGTLETTIRYPSRQANVLGFQVRSTGSADLVITSIDTDNHDEVTLDSISPTSFTGSDTLSAGDVRIVNIAFTPETGPFSFDVIIESNYLEEPVYEFTVTGIGAFAWTYTIDNDPSANADFEDIGEAIVALQSYGVARPTTLEIYDDGSGYASTADYRFEEIPGVSANNPVTFRAAQGHIPRIIGAQAPTSYTFYIDGTAGIAFGNGAQHIRLIGLEFDLDGATQGVAFYSSSSVAPIDHIHIDGCRFHGSAGPAIAGYGLTGRLNNIEIRNCWFWDNDGQQVGSSTSVLSNRGTVCFMRWDSGVFEHNTIYADTANPAVYYGHLAGSQLDRFDNNIIVYMGSGEMLERQGSIDPISADGNIYYFPNGSFHSNYTFSQWRSAGFDQHGLVADPLLRDPASGDLGISAISPAKDFVPNVLVDRDIHRAQRPVGLGADAGAEEVSPNLPPGVGVRTVYGETIRHNDSFQLADFGANVPMRFVLQVGNIRGQTLELTGTPRVEIVGTDQATADILAQPVTDTLGFAEFTEFEIEITATGVIGAQASVEMLIETNDALYPVFSFELRGDIVPPRPEIVIERAEYQPIDSFDGLDLIPVMLPIGVETELVYTIRNLGSAPLDLTGTPDPIQFSSMWQLAGEPTIVQAPDTTIDVQESTTFTIALEPIGEMYNFRIHVPNNDPNTFNSDYLFVVQGTAGPLPAASLSDTNVDFGTVAARSSSQRTIELYNDGVGELELLKFTLSDSSGAWRVASSTPAIPYFGSSLVLGPVGSGSDTMVISFEFAPSEASENPLSAQLDIETNDPNNPVLTLTFTGIADPPAATEDESGCAIGIGNGSSGSALLLGLVMIGLIAARRRSYTRRPRLAFVRRPVPSYLIALLAVPLMANLASAQTFNVGEPDNTFAGGDYTTAMPALVFDASIPLEVEDVVIYPQTTGDVRIDLQDANQNGMLIDQRTITVTGTGAQRVAVNFVVTPGTYWIRYNHPNSSVDGLWYNIDSNYSYDVPGVISITGNTIGDGNYYHFYDWTIQTGPALGVEEQSTSTLFANPGGTHDVGDVTTGTAHSISFELQNIEPSGTSLDVTSINSINLNNVTNVTATPSSATGITNSSPQNLVVQYTPQNHGSFSFTLEFDHTGINASPLDIEIEGFAGPRIAVENDVGTPIGNGSMYVPNGVFEPNQAEQIDFVIRNTGVENLDVSDIRTLNPTNVTINSVTPTSFTGSNEIAPSGTGTFTIEMTPQSPGTFSFEVEIDSNDGDTPLYSFTFQDGALFPGGTYTIDNDPNANPDFDDIGDAIVAMGNYGVAGPVVFEIYDDGTGYESTTDYAIGAIAGTSPTNTITFRAAPGHQPRIIGAAAPTNYSFYIDPEAGIAFTNNAQHIRLIGLEFDVDGDTQGVAFYSSSFAEPIDDIIIDGCYFHSSAGPAICGYGLSDRLNNIDVRNCFFWNNDGARVGTSTSTISSRGTVSFVRWQGGQFRHNTIFAESNMPAVYYNYLTSRYLERFENNIVVNLIGDAVERSGSVDHGFADGNLYYAPNGEFHNVYDFSQWNSAGYDQNGMQADPRLLDPPDGDLRIAIDSPARDAAPALILTHDHFGTVRPVGLAPDIGAEEFVPTGNPAIGARSHLGQAIYSGQPHELDRFGQDVPLVYSLQLINMRGGTLSLSGSPAVSLFSSSGADVQIIEQPAQTQLTAGQATSFQLEVTATGNLGSQVEIELRVQSNDPNRPTFTIELVGEIIVPTPVIQLERVEMVPIDPDSGIDKLPFVLAEGQPSEVTYTIRNLGSAPLELFGIPEYVNFPVYEGLLDEPVVGQQPDSVIGIQDTTTFTVVVHPIEPNFSFAMQVLSFDPDPTRANYTILVEGVSGPTPLASASPLELDFGEATMLDDAVERTLLIENLGSGELHISRLALTDPSGSWRLTASDPPLPIYGSPIVLAPEGQVGSTLELIFEFAPSVHSSDPMNALLDIETNDPNNPHLQVSFEGVAKPRQLGGGGGPCAATFSGPRRSMPVVLPLALLALCLFSLRRRRAPSITRASVPASRRRRPAPVGMLAALCLLLTPALAHAGYPEVLYYQFNEGSGTSTENLASPGQGSSNAAFQGTVNWVSPGMFGDAINTQNGYVDSGWNTQFTGSFTIEMWMRAASGQSGLNYFFGDSSLSSFRAFKSGTSIWVRGGGLSDTVVSGISNGTWFHFVFVYDASTNQTHIYINGNLEQTVSSQTPTSSTSSGTFLVGTYATFTSSRWTGDIDEFRFWNQARSQSEIQAFMNSELGGLRFENVATGEEHNVSGETSVVGAQAPGTTGAVTYRASSFGGTIDISDARVTNESNVTNASVSPTSASGISSTNTEDFDVTFEPQVAGAFSFTLEFDHNDPAFPSPFVLNVEGWAGPRLSVEDPDTGAIIEAGAVYLPEIPITGQQSNTFELRFHSVGSDDLDVTSITTDNEFNVTIDSIDPTDFTGGNELAPSTSEPVVVRFTPQFGGFSFDLVIESNDVVDPVYSFTIVGSSAYGAGLYTIDNDPASNPDFTDIGAANAALKAYGINGPVVFLVHDDGTGYVSNTNYRFDGIPGASLESSVTFQAAPGHTPRIIGAGAATNYSFYIDPFAGIAFGNDAQHIRLIGLEFDIAGATQGVAFYSSSINEPVRDIVIDGCRFHSSNGPAISGYGLSNRLLEVDIRNCWFYNNTGERVGTSTSVISSRGTVSFVRWQGGLFRHNTIFADSDEPAIYYNFLTAQRLERFENNIVVYEGENEVIGRGGTLDWTFAEGNLYWAPNAADFHTDYTYSQWQAAGFDQNGMIADPLLRNPQAGDLRLALDTPAKDAAQALLVERDIFRTYRAIGLAADIGAEELAPNEPGLSVRAPTGLRMHHAGSFVLDEFGENVPMSFTLYVMNERGAVLELSPNAVQVVGTSQASAAIVEQPQSLSLASGESTPFVLEIQATGPVSQIASVQLEIESNDPTYPLFTVELTGEIVTPTPFAQLERQPFETIPPGNTEVLPVTLPLDRTSEITFTMRNSGSDTLVLTGSPSVQFSGQTGLLGTPDLSDVPDTGIGVQSSTSFTVEVTPTDSSFSFTMVIPTSDPDAARGNYTVTVTGSAGLLPAATVHEEVISFGTAQVGFRTTGTAYVINEGPAPLEIVGVTLHDPSGMWRLLNAHPQLPIHGNSVTIDPFGGETYLLELNFEFAPTEHVPDPLSAVLTIETNDPFNPVLEIQFTGNSAPRVGSAGGCTTQSATSNAPWFALLLLAAALLRLRRQI